MNVLSKFLVLLALLTIVVNGGFVHAQDDLRRNINDDVQIRDTDIIVDDPIRDEAYLAGRVITVLDEIGGNFWGAAGLIEINGEIGESFYGIANNINILKTVNENAFIVARNLNINAEISGNVYIVAEDVFINADIGNDVNIIASRVIINKDFGDDVKIKADEVYVNGEFIEGSLNVEAYKLYLTNNMVVDDGLIINGNEIDEVAELSEYTKYGLLDYRSTGIPTSFDNMPKQSEVPYAGIAKLTKLAYAGFGIVTLILLLGDILVTFILFKIFPVNSLLIVRNLDFSKRKIGLNLATAIIFMFISFLALVIAFISLMGWPLFIIVLLLLLLILQISKYFGIYKIGSMLINKIQPRLSNNIFLNSLVGELVLVIIILALALIPLIGNFLVALFATIFTLWTVGALVRVKLDALRKVYRN